MQDRIMILNTQLAKVLNAIPATNQPPGPGRDMTFVEKRKLSTQLSRLQVERISHGSVGAVAWLCALSIRTRVWPNRSSSTAQLQTLR